MKKPRLAKKTLWVSTSAGKPTGYGATPAAASKDAARREADRIARQDQAMGKHRLCAMIDAEERVSANLMRQLTNTKGELAALMAHRAPVINVEAERHDGRIMMAMAFLQERDPRTAAERMHKLTPSGGWLDDKHQAAIQRITRIAETWERRVQECTPKLRAVG